MKDQYFGDVNDYLKYGLLRCCLKADFQIGVCWMLTPSDHRGDGDKVSYLQDPESWRSYDPQLFDLLNESARGNVREVGRLEHSRLLGDATFFSEFLTDNGLERNLYFARALRRLATADLWFFDPDAGLEVTSVPYGRSGSSRYLYLKEIAEAWQTGASLVVFQHFTREKRDSLVARRAEELRSYTRASSVVPIRSANVVFFAVCQSVHRQQVDRALELIQEHWGGRLHIDPSFLQVTT